MPSGSKMRSRKMISLPLTSCDESGRPVAGVRVGVQRTGRIEEILVVQRADTLGQRRLVVRADHGVGVGQAAGA